MGGATWWHYLHLALSTIVNIAYIEFEVRVIAKQIFRSIWTHCIENLFDFTSNALPQFFKLWNKSTFNHIHLLVFWMKFSILWKKSFHSFLVWLRELGVKKKVFVDLRSVTKFTIFHFSFNYEYIEAGVATKVRFATSFQISRYRDYKE